MSEEATKWNILKPARAWQISLFNTDVRSSGLKVIFKINCSAFHLFSLVQDVKDVDLDSDDSDNVKIQTMESFVRTWRDHFV